MRRGRTKNWTSLDSWLNVSILKKYFSSLFVLLLLLTLVQIDNSKLDELYQSEDIGIFTIKRKD